VPEARFRSCGTDDDCVTLPLASCCHNGWKVSVSREHADEYRLSFTCPTERPFCPKYLVVDRRVAACDQGSHLCEMVPTDDDDTVCDDHCAPASVR
jgi:hypothetical protein